MPKDKMTDKQELIEALKKEYATQDNRATAYPTYVTVQELTCIGVIADGYSVCCPYGDGETRIEYKHDNYEGSYANKQELIDQMKEDYGHEPNFNIAPMIEDIEEVNLGYIWHPVEFFLTIKGAEKYILVNAHNHGKLRTYVSHFNIRNFEMRSLLEAIGFKVKD